MKLPSWIFEGLWNRLVLLRKERAELRLQVSNLTRHTVLATAMEIADNGRKRNKGLLGREQLAYGEGLWIVPCQAVHTIGMKFPIDLIYLNRKKRIKKLSHAVPPWRLSICLSAQSVLELPAGTIRDTQTQTGDTLELLPAPMTSERVSSQG